MVVPVVEVLQLLEGLKEPEPVELKVTNRLWPMWALSPTTVTVQVVVTPMSTGEEAQLTDAPKTKLTVTATMLEVTVAGVDSLSVTLSSNDQLPGAVDAVVANEKVVPVAPVIGENIDAPGASSNHW